MACPQCGSFASKSTTEHAQCLTCGAEWKPADDGRAVIAPADGRHEVGPPPELLEMWTVVRERLLVARLRAESLMTRSEELVRTTRELRDDAHRLVRATG